jgi:hypothetical protein
MVFSWFKSEQRERRRKVSPTVKGIHDTDPVEVMLVASAQSDAGYTHFERRGETVKASQ